MRWKLACTLLVVAGLLVAGLGGAVTARAAVPSLRLFASTSAVTESQLQLRFGALDPGVWIAPVGGAFQVDVTRPNYGPWRAQQVDPLTDAPLRQLPMSAVDPARGFPGFLTVSFGNRRGRTVARRLVAFCPNGESARLDDSGPMTPTYPGDCSEAGFFPFVRGIVWGIDSGWAVVPSAGGFAGPVPFPVQVRLPPGVLRHLRGGINLKPGSYTELVSITRSFRALFGIPRREASVTIHMRVTRSRIRRISPVVVVHRSLARRLAATPVTPAPDPATMPNLVALPAWRIGIHHHGKRDLLTFNATIWNAGPAPFSIEGYRRPHSNLMDAFEYFFNSAGSVVGRESAGTMFYDNQRGHHHWHLRQLAAYSLIGRAGHEIRSQKQSFCIAPTDGVDLTVPGADLSQSSFGGPGFGFSVCDLYDPSAIWLREQLPVGWGDTYNQSVAGQAIDITHVPNGTYRIEVQVNPLGLLHETTSSDDVAFRKLRLSGRPGARKVTVAPWHGITG